jgi:hypothetical protein
VRHIGLRAADLVQQIGGGTWSGGRISPDVDGLCRSDPARCTRPAAGHFLSGALRLARSLTRADVGQRVAVPGLGPRIFRFLVSELPGRHTFIRPRGKAHQGAGPGIRTTATIPVTAARNPFTSGMRARPQVVERCDDGRVGGCTRQVRAEPDAADCLQSTCGVGHRGNPVRRLRGADSPHLGS